MMFFILLLLSAMDWSSDIVEDNSWESSGNNCLMVLNETWYPTFLTSWSRSRFIDDWWTTDTLGISFIEAASYDDENHLAALFYQYYAQNDSVYICFTPDIDDSMKTVKLDSMGFSEGRYVSGLEFVDKKPIFTYTHFRRLSDEFKTSSFLKFAWQDGEKNWYTEVIDSAIWNDGESSLGLVVPSLTMGYDGIPYVIFMQGHESGNGCVLRLAYKTNEEWELETIYPTVALQGKPCKTFGVDDNDFVHVLHSYNNWVYYTTNLTGQWVTDTLDSLPPWVSGTQCWMSVTSDGHPVGVSTRIDDASEKISKYFRHDGSQWHKEECPYAVWFELDRWDNPHLMGAEGYHDDVLGHDTILHYWVGTGVSKETEDVKEIQLTADIMHGARSMCLTRFPTASTAP
jgi:hypothetical protein